jgi:conserved oligomeric Golgi complex subunit 5
MMGRGGEELLSPRAQQQPLELKNDPRFTAFLSSNFNPSEFASSALQDTHTTAQAQIDYLQQGIAVLDGQLRQLVLQHRGELISHTSKLDETDGSLQRISLSVRSLQSVAARVRAEVIEPYQQIVTRTQQLSNVQRTVDLLRHTIHRVKLVQRLRAEMKSGSTDIMEIAKAARLLSDIRTADSEADLSGLTAIEDDAEFLAVTNTSVRSHINAALRAGLDSLSQAEVGSALQALYNLHELRPAVEAHIDLVVAALEKNFSAAMDPRKLSASTGGATAGASGVRGVVGALQGATTRVQEALWERLTESFDGLWRSGVAIWHLQRVLFKKRDPLTHDLFINIVSPTEDDHLPLDLFWEKLSVALSQAFATAFSTQRGGFVRDALVQYYPRIAGLLEMCCSRILKDGSARDAPAALTPQHAAHLLATPKDAESAYLSSVHSRLQGAATTAFPGGSRALPTAADIQTLVARVNEELKAAIAGGDRLATLVASVAGSALHMAADRAEMMAAGGPEVRALTGSGGGGGGGSIICNAAQSRNISLCNALQEIHRSVCALISRLPPTASAALVSPVDAVQAAALDLAVPLFRAMVDSAQDRIMKMHALNLGADEGAESSVIETSAYMRDLVRQLTQYRIEFFSKFVPPPTIGISSSSSSNSSSVARALVERLASRILIFFVRHAALVRPLSRSGKLQLAKDIGELEAVVTQQLVPAEILGSPLKSLRSFRRLLFTETVDLENNNSQLLLKDLPAVVVMHHLFSRGPTLLESPHTRNKLSPSQYSLWLDEHTQEEAVKYIKSAAEAGAVKVTGQAEGMQVVALIKWLADQVLA